MELYSSSSLSSSTTTTPNHGSPTLTMNHNHCHTNNINNATEINSIVKIEQIDQPSTSSSSTSSSSSSLSPSPPTVQLSSPNQLVEAAVIICSNPLVKEDHLNHHSHHQHTIVKSNSIGNIETISSPPLVSGQPSLSTSTTSIPSFSSFKLNTSYSVGKGLSCPNFGSSSSSPSRQFDLQRELDIRMLEVQKKEDEIQQLKLNIGQLTEQYSETLDFCCVYSNDLSKLRKELHQVKNQFVQREEQYKKQVSDLQHKIYSLPKHVKYLDNNVDLICLLLTCKKFYYNQLRERSIKFKHIVVVNHDDQDEDQQDKDKGHQFDTSYMDLVETVDQYRLHSFKDIFQNTLADHYFQVNDPMVQLRYYHDMPSWINKESSPSSSSSSSSSSYSEENPKTTVYLVTQQYKTFNLPSTTQTMYFDLCLSGGFGRVDIPYAVPPNFMPSDLNRLVLRSDRSKINEYTLPNSLKSLSLTLLNSNINDEVDIPFPLCLEHLWISKRFSPLQNLKLNSLVSLRSLTVSGAIQLEKGVLPSTLTKLDLPQCQQAPPDDFFYSLTNLVDLRVTIKRGAESEQQRPRVLFDLQNNPNLESFTLKEEFGFGMFDNDFEVLFSARPCKLKHLSIPKQTLVNEYPDTLESLEVALPALIKANVTTLPCSLRSLWLGVYEVPVPTNLIPDSVQHLTLHKLDLNTKIVSDGFTFPDSIKKLVLLNLPHKEYVSLQLPKYLQQIKWDWNKVPSKLPEHRTTLKATHFPSTLESIDYSRLTMKCEIQLPTQSTISSLSIFFSWTEFVSRTTVFSLFKVPGIALADQPFPPTIKHLKCVIGGTPNEPFIFRLDEIFNRTNIDELQIQIRSNTWNYSIRRLDATNILFIEKNTIGGLIKQTILKNENGDDDDQYQPIYLYRYDPSSPMILKRDIFKK
ncbi:hypothetical protein DFA_02439 [Cavenderia fasciculata]|uniref:FNIP repeat-containing protein n=1 Tax=Cavenderia fasciculata TaxID=261658 RepID=F4PZG2_CACFS|nr:uncharacterized protein DFA_02439 [Cavenderia fasciculata]EGG19191.1 hypothetical protein DFA_02439 [Cavenderia fasciculata]|eukprot:XP_004366824.1 hypothetical protein DFA_02439 [Cavenderia fasciculata]